MSELHPTPTRLDIGQWWLTDAGRAVLDAHGGDR